MKFSTPRRDMDFEIPDEWWSFTEMASFHPDGDAYYPYSLCHAGLVQVVPLSLVQPPTRNAGNALLKKFKLVPVLLAFQSPECALPPVEVVSLNQPNSYQYRVRNGCHRYYTSVAAGYTNLPVVSVS